MTDQAAHQPEFPSAREAVRRTPDSDFVRTCIKNIEVGDSMLFAEMLRDRIVYNELTREWFLWNGICWERDLKRFALAMTSDVVDAYMDERKKIQQDLEKAKDDDIPRLKGLIKAVNARKRACLTTRGRMNILKNVVSIHNPLSITGEELDINPWLFACKNKIIDLKTGDTIEPRPDQHITTASSVEFKGLDEPAPRWSQFLLEVFQENHELIAFVLKLLGYALVGKTVHHIFPIFYGRHGRNGKGTIIKILYHIMGELAGPIRTEMLLRQRYSGNADGPSPSIMSLKGLRLAIASEPNEGERFDMGKVKLYTGGDRLKGRHPNDKYEIKFDPTHLLVLLSNEKPGAKYDDKALWERILCINFNLMYVAEPKEDYERKADPHLEDKLKDEASGILASLIKGCLLWQKEGLIPPKSVKDFTEKWRASEDDLAGFLDDCCELSDDKREASAILYSVFNSWWSKNIDARRIPSAKKFGIWMSNKFEKVKSNGKQTYLGVSILPTLPGEYLTDD